MRQFLDRMDKPRVDEIGGIPAAIAIEQANPVKSSRSTVGTMTEINDYLKLLMPRIARGFCPNCGREIRPETARSIADHIFQELSGQNVLITFWVAVPPKTEPRAFFDFIQQQGYLRIWIDNEIVRVDSDKKIKRLGARVQVVQDRIAITETNRARLVEAIETALRFGKDKINVIPLHPSSSANPARTAHPFSIGWHCAHCDLDIRPPSPGLFSFNNPLGACPECRGFGRTIAIDLNKAIPDRTLSLAQGAVRVFRGQEFGESQKDLLRACAREEIDINIPFEELPRADQEFVINGEKRSDGVEDDDDEDDGRWYGVRGFFRWAESKTFKMHMRVLLSRYRAYTMCPSCHGGRFQPDALNYKVSVGAAVSAADRTKAAETAATTVRLVTLPEFQSLAISDVCECLGKIDIATNDKTAEMLRGDICARLNYLCEVGVGYLSLDRSTRTL